VTNYIPEKPSTLGRDPSTAKLLLAGSPKVGKTTITTESEGTLLIATEMGYATIPNIYPVYVTRWKQFLAVLEEIKGKPEIKRVVIDTFSRLCSHAEDQVCKDLDVDAIGDAGYARGYTGLKKMLLKGMSRLMGLGKQVVLIAHTKEGVVRVGNKEKTQVRIDLPSAAARFVQAEVDAIMYYTIENNPSTMKPERFIYFKGSDALEIGGRYLPGVEIPEKIRIPAPPEKGWDLVNEVLTRGFVPQS